MLKEIGGRLRDGSAEGSDSQSNHGGIRTRGQIKGGSSISYMALGLHGNDKDVIQKVINIKCIIFEQRMKDGAE